MSRPKTTTLTSLMGRSIKVINAWELQERPTSSTFAEAKRRSEAKVALENDDESDDWDGDLSGFDDERAPPQSPSLSRQART